MKGLTFFLMFILCISFVTETEAGSSNGDGVYIVYMGSASSAANAYRAQILINTMFKRRGNDIVHTYKHGFTGFAARLTAEEAKVIAKKQGVVSVFPDPNYKLHTTHSWDFLKYQTSVKIDSGPSSSAVSDGSYDSIIGILDTGIWPESESFNDKDMGPIPSRWKGTCMEAKDFNSSNCNRKIIGARFYKNPEDDSEYFTSRDVIGHGSHVSSTAAGSAVENASYYGVAPGTAKGGSPNARIAMYKVCNPGGCTGSSILAAFDDAIADGVDVLSLSLGAPSYARIELNTDPIAIGAFHAVEQGILVICSAGNDGPNTGTVVNTAPWIMTVAANTIDRDLESDVLLGVNKVIKGEGIHFGNVSKSPVYPLIHGKSAKKADASEGTARTCESGSLDPDKVKGKIVLCENVDGSYYASNAKDEVKSKGGIGCIFVDDRSRAVASAYGAFPTTVIDSKEADEIFSYLNSTKDPVATILPTVTVEKFTPAPAIAYFSSRGPSSLTRNILKPDIVAPGVNILASWVIGDINAAPEGKAPPLVNIESGTSMSCPHVSGIAARLKSENPSWSPAAIRSAIMTTAVQMTNTGSHITTETGAKATPYDFGAGQVTIFGSSSPGLIYETNHIDYMNFLCYYGFTSDQTRKMSNRLPQGFACPEQSNKGDISNINYPSISVSNFNGEESRRINRTVTNVASRFVGDEDTVYTVSVDAPKELLVRVIPRRLHFKKVGDKLSYQVIFSSSTSKLQEDAFGLITWSSGMYIVRSPFAVTSKDDDETDQ
ncbi:unnamed protein product [Cochlearia groenlandica]